VIGVFGCFFFAEEVMLDETMDIFAVSKYLKISRWSIYQLTRKNKIPCHRPTGRKLVFFRRELEEFIREPSEPNGVVNRRGMAPAVNIGGRNMNAVSTAREYLEKAAKPVPLGELLKETGISERDIIWLERNGVINAWYKSAGNDIPAEFFDRNFSSVTADVAKEIAKFMAGNPGRVIRRHEITDTLKVINDTTTFYIMGNLETAGAVIPFYGLAPDPSCDVCIHRLKCKKERRAERCDMFQDDYRLAV
jgi:excisionase family DNA binding protein